MTSVKWPSGCEVFCAGVRCRISGHPKDTYMDDRRKQRTFSGRYGAQMDTKCGSCVSLCLPGGGFGLDPRCFRSLDVRAQRRMDWHNAQTLWWDLRVLRLCPLWNPRVKRYTEGQTRLVRERNGSFPHDLAMRVIRVISAVPQLISSNTHVVQSSQRTLLLHGRHWCEEVVVLPVWPYFLWRWKHQLWDLLSHQLVTRAVQRQPSC